MELPSDTVGVGNTDSTGATVMAVVASVGVGVAIDADADADVDDGAANAMVPDGLTGVTPASAVPLTPVRGRSGIK